MSSIKIRSKRTGHQTQIRTLISHPMDNGRFKDQSGNLIPAHFIQELKLELNGNLLLKSYMGGSISKNPYFDFMLKDVKAGDTIRISWIDNLGKTDSQEHHVR